MKKSVSKWMALLLSVIMIVMCAAGCSKAQTQQPASDHMVFSHGFLPRSSR